jgi:hypothetical protein
MCEQRLPMYLVIDVSRSIAGARLDTVNQIPPGARLPRQGPDPQRRGPGLHDRSCRGRPDPAAAVRCAPRRHHTFSDSHPMEQGRGPLRSMRSSKESQSTSGDVDVAQTECHIATKLSRKSICRSTSRTRCSGSKRTGASCGRGSASVLPLYTTEVSTR